MPSIERKVVIVLDNIRSHHNVGSLFRSGDAFGIEKLILGGISPCPPHRDIQKTALGATESVAWQQVTDLSEVMVELKNEGYHIVSIEQDGRSRPLPEPKDIAQAKIALILGNEVDGVDHALIELSDAVWEIRQTGLKKSLNVSVCGGICMFHLLHRI